jgi:hypothetical protein
MTKTDRWPESAARCRRCDTAIDFLSTCPSCGTVAGIDPTLSDAVTWARPHLTLVENHAGTQTTAAGRPPVVRSAAPSYFPTELTRAWDIAVLPSKRRRLVPRFGAVLATVGLVVVAVAGVGLALKATGHSPAATAAAVSAPRLVTQAFPATGVSFTAALPSGAIRTSSRMQLAGLPYTATTYSGVSDGVSYSASVYPFPIGKPTMSADKFLRTFTDNIAASHALAMPGASFGTFDGLPSMSVVLESADHQLFVNVFEVLDGHIEYVMSAYGTSYHVPGFAQLASSFHLLGH